MAFPTLSALEIVKLIAKAKEVYDAFADDYDNAPNRIKELADTIGYLHDILEELRVQLESYRADYPGSASFAKKLQECDAFIRKYSELRPVDSFEPSSSRSKLGSTLKRVWQTTKWAFADATQLKDGLSQEMLKLNTFILVFALKRTTPSSHQQPAHEVRSSNGDNFRSIFSQLQKIPYSREREMSLAAQQGRQPDLSAVYVLLDNIWQSLYEKAGYTQGIPPLQVEKLLDSLSQHWNEIIIGLFGPSSRYPLDIISSRGAEPGSNCKATIIYGNSSGGHRRKERLTSFRIPPSLSGRAILWFGESRGTTLIHHLSSNPSPYTQHKSSEHPFTAIFHGTNRLVVSKRNHDVVRDTEVEIEYRFDDAEGLQVFLQEVRGMDLVDTFHFEKIISARSPAFYGESSHEALHIWRMRDLNAACSLTFFANGEERRILEFPLSLFEDAVVRHKSKRVVQINFIQQAPTQEKKGWLRRKFSRSSPRTSSQDILALGTPGSPSDMQMLPLERAQSSSAPSPSSPGKDLVNQLKFLSITFESKTECEHFVTEFGKAKQGDDAPPLYAYTLPSPQLDPSSAQSDTWNNQFGTSPPSFRSLPPSSMEHISHSPPVQRLIRGSPSISGDPFSTSPKSGSLAPMTSSTTPSSSMFVTPPIPGGHPRNYMGDLGIYSDDPTHPPSLLLPDPKMELEDGPIEEVDGEDREDGDVGRMEMG